MSRVQMVILLYRPAMEFKNANRNRNVGIPLFNDGNTLCIDASDWLLKPYARVAFFYSTF